LAQADEFSRLRSKTCPEGLRDDISRDLAAALHFRVMLFTRVFNYAILARVMGKLDSPFGFFRTDHDPPKEK
jgi:hypothetical protein